MDCLDLGLCRIVSRGGKSGVQSGTRDVFVTSQFVLIGDQDTIPVESNRSEGNPSSFEVIVRDLLMIDGVATELAAIGSQL